MLKPYRTIDDVLRSPWAQNPPTVKAETTDRVLRSTKLEDTIYAELRQDDADMDALEAEGAQKLKTFPALSRDVYQSFYSLMQRRTEEEKLSSTAQKFNTKLLDNIVQSEDYATIKSICEGRELPAYESASEFVSHTAENLDDLLSELTGEKGALSTLERLESAASEAEEKLRGLLERIRQSGTPNETLERAAVNAANKADSKQRQAAAVSKLVDTALAQKKEQLSQIMTGAMRAAGEKAQEVQDVLGAWGDEAGGAGRSEVNMELLRAVRQSPVLLDISRYLGRFREIFAQGKKNGYAYGRGEKYTLELGNDLSRTISSEMAMLAMPETLPLFLRKYQCRQIKQFRRREPIHKGAGDIICCLDESGSTAGNAAAWGKAIAMTLLEIAVDGGRKFALIHFSGSGSVKTDLFLPKQYTAKDKLDAAETFLDGGTDFVTPLRESLRLMESEGFENADVVFITDGECALPEEFREQFNDEQERYRFTVTGILLDQGHRSMAFSLEQFCENIYRTSELLGDEIVRALVEKRV